MYKMIRLTTDSL